MTDTTRRHLTLTSRGPDALSGVAASSAVSASSGVASNSPALNSPALSAAGSVTVAGALNVASTVSATSRCDGAVEHLLDAAEERIEATGLLQVGDLAKATGKTVRAIHLYEDMGLIEATRRSPGRYRLFSPDTKVRIRWISKLQSLGLSLTEIQAIVGRRQSSESARLAAAELREVYTAKLAEVRNKLREYLALEQELEASVEFLDGCQHGCAVSVHATGCSVCSRRTEPLKVLPDLVVGAQLS